MTSSGKTHSPAEYWKEMPSFYRDLIRNGWKQAAMLELVEQLSRSTWAERIYPSTSLDALGLSLHERYHARCNAPMVYIRYDGSADAFEVIYQKGQGRTVSSETHRRVDDEVWERVLAWIDGRVAA